MKDINNGLVLIVPDKMDYIEINYMLNFKSIKLYSQQILNVALGILNNYKNIKFL